MLQITYKAPFFYFFEFRHIRQLADCCLRSSNIASKNAKAKKLAKKFVQKYCKAKNFYRKAKYKNINTKAFTFL